YVLSTIPTWYLVDTLGRRVILLSGATAMAIALTLVGFFLYLDQSYTPVAVVTSVIIYNAAFGFSWGPIPWLYPPEILPNAFRVKGVSLSTASNWAFVGEATPILQEAIRWRLYPMHAGFCVLSFIVVYIAFPETMGVPLEEMDELFGDQPTRPLLSSSPSHHSFQNPLDGAPLRRSHSFPGFRRGQPHEHSDASEPPKIGPRPRRHQRTLSGGASLPGKGGPGVKGVQDWWTRSREGSQAGSVRGPSRPGTPGGQRNYQTVRQDEPSSTTDEESAIH
ncbi:hypothetical protein JCM16303_004218, partial [Sporobolomyces ruberrimus]